MKVRNSGVDFNQRSAALAAFDDKVANAELLLQNASAGDLFVGRYGCTTA
jgi:hypothetical protein